MVKWVKKAGKAPLKFAAASEPLETGRLREGLTAIIRLPWRRRVWLKIRGWFVPAPGYYVSEIDYETRTVTIQQSNDVPLTRMQQLFADYTILVRRDIPEEHEVHGP